MKDMDLEQYKSAWKNEQAFNEIKLSQEDIQKYLKSSSKSISRLFLSGLKTDIFLKSLLFASFAGLILLFAGEILLVWINIALMAITLLGIVFQYLCIKKIPGVDRVSANMKTILERKISYYYKYHVKALIVGAFSNSLVVISGMMYFFYYRYNGIRPLEAEDYLVLGGIIVLSFVLGLFVQLKQHSFHIKQLEMCLDEINEDTLTQHTLNVQKNRRNRNILIGIFALVAGLLLLSYFIFQ